MTVPRAWFPLAGYGEALTPGAFFSYVRFNDDRDDGRIGQLCEDLSREVQAQTGDPFPIWRDRNDIAWGEQWEERLQSRSRRRHLPPRRHHSELVQELFFCRKRVRRFLKVEKKRVRRDLILPIVYIEARVVTDEKLREQDPIAQELARRQLFSFTDLRFEPWTSADVGKRIAQMATAIRDALLRDVPPIPAPKVESASAMPATAKPETVFAAEAKTEAVSAGRTPFSSPAPAPVKTRVVDLFPGRGDHTSISEAIGVAAPGERILVRPGLYREGLVLDKALDSSATVPSRKSSSRPTARAACCLRPPMAASPISPFARAAAKKSTASTSPKAGSTSKTAILPAKATR